MVLIGLISLMIENATVEEVRRAHKNVKNGKALSPFGIMSYLLKVVRQHVIEKLIGMLRDD